MYVNVNVYLSHVYSAYIYIYIDIDIDISCV